MVMENNKYSSGKIYRIWNLLNDKIYVGSTVQPLYKRMIGHRSDAGKDICKNVKLYEEMRTLGPEHFRIELIELYSCNTKDELTRREGEVIRELKPVLNMQIAGRTTKEWCVEHKEHLEEKRKEYFAKHKDHLIQRQKAYNEANKEHFAEYKKQWYETNRERIKAKFKDMYDENPEIYREKAKQYRKDNPELMKQKDKERYERHNEKTLAQQKQFRLDNLELVKQRERDTYERNKHKYVEKFKQYREAHKDKIKEYSKQYRETNKEQLAAKEKERYTCSICGSCIRKKEKPAHERTNKHLQALEANKVEP